MRFSMLICILTLCSCSFSQSKFSAFTGGIEFGIGANKFVDFNELTNYPNLEREWYKYKLQHFPIQFGFFTDKYINGSEYIELAIVYASRSVSRILVNSYTLNSWHITVPSGHLFCIDLPVKYYMKEIRIFKRQFKPFVGVIPSMVFAVDFSDEYYNIPGQYFNKTYLSLCTGLSFHKGISRFKLHLSTAVTSITKWKYKNEIQAVNEGYRGVIFPCEVLVVYGFVIGG